jgi:putative ABC transport system permease protein
MLHNYLKIALRNLLRNRVFSIVNILGLGLGIAAFVFILEYVSLEKSVNQFHTNIGQMYRLLEENENGQFDAQVAPGWAAFAKERLPEITDYCRFEEGIAAGIVQKAEGDASFREENIGYVEGNFFSFFDFPLISGRAESLKQPNTVFLSAS